MRSEKEIRGWHDELKQELADGLASMEATVAAGTVMAALRWVLNDPDVKP